MSQVRPLILLAIGLALAAFATILLTGLSESTGFADLAWRLVIFGISLSLMLTPLSVAAINAVPWTQAGMASAANTALRQYGGALGPAVLGAIYVSVQSGGSTASTALHTALITNAVILLVAAVVCIFAAFVKPPAAVS